MNEIKIGDKFKLKSSTSNFDLHRISYGEDTIDWIRAQKEFIRVKDTYSTGENKIRYYNNDIGGNCYFLTEMVEPVKPRGFNHPLTPIFK